MKLTQLLVAAAVLASALSHPSIAADPPAATGASNTQGTATAALSAGEVKSIDKSAGKITLKHGPLANLDMPAMTMVFRVRDPAMLEQVKAGDKVRFEAENAAAGITVTKMQKTK